MLTALSSSRSSLLALPMVCRSLAGYSPLFAVRQSAKHDDACDSDDEGDEAEEALASVADVLAAVAFKALIQSVVLPVDVLKQGAVKRHLEAHPLSEDKTPVDGTGQPKVDKDGKRLGPTAVAANSGPAAPYNSWALLEKED